jgi:2,3-bisphosphoglycerate-dependent phosphoglycerate mutase
MEGILVLVRHGESEWNARNIWTGLCDVGLTEKGKAEAAASASLITDISFENAYTSELKRAQQSLSIILGVLGKPDLPVVRSSALNERDYGVFTGKNKADIKMELGDVEFFKLRRGYDYPVKNGESLKQVYARVVPYYVSTMIPLLTVGKHILVVAHGNSLRALMKKVENITDDKIADVELATGEIVVYRIDSSGALISKEKRYL